MTDEELLASTSAVALAAGAEADTTEEEDPADIWAEFDALDALSPEDEDAKAVAAASAEDGEDDVGGDDTGSTVAEGSLATDAAADTATEAVGAAVAATPSVWDTAPEELRTEYQKLAADKARLEHEVRSHKGRAVGAQRRYEELRQAAAPRKVEGDRPSPQAALAAMKEDYPEIAGPLEQAFGAIEGQVATLSAAEESRRTAAQTELTDFLDTEAAAVEAQHPGYLDVLKANGDALVAWVDDQPRAVREAFARNANEIVDAAEASTVIGMFKAHLGMPAAAPASAGARTAPTAKLDSRRERQLAATSNPTRAARRPTLSGIPESGDPQEIWDAFEELERRR